MAKKWMRMIDSAQRRIVLERPKTLTYGVFDQLVVDIQGLVVTTADKSEYFPYSAMADYGVKILGSRPLTAWQRLMRRPANIGKIELDRPSTMVVAFWTNPCLDLIFDIEDDDQVFQWKECEIMALSAGFHFEIADDLHDLPLRKL